MKHFEFILPTRIKFGEGVCSYLTDEIRNMGKTRPLIITDKGLIQAGIVKKITDI